MAKEHQDLHIYGDDVRADISIEKDGKIVKDLGPMFEGAREVHIDVPEGDLVYLEGVDEKREAVYLDILSEDKMPEVCIVDPKSGKRWCNYDVFKSGEPPERIRKWFNVLSDAIKLIEDHNPAAKDALRHIVQSINVVEEIPEDTFEYEAGAMSTHPSDAPICQITISSKWLDPESPEVAVRFLTHELGHCQEVYHRAIRYLPYHEGEWKEKRGKVIPVGNERVAEHYSKRVFRKVYNL
ncbi:MAG: hypothetical protein GXO43_01585 [Crenarchaeota archaeon]|nr:hypothetical protein [Thermoproteota archaeon]